MDATPHTDIAEERRTSPRFPVHLPGTLSLLSLGSTSNCTVTELSVEGCRVRTLRDFIGGADTRIEVSFTLKGAAFRVAGLTQWAHGKNEIGIRFVGLSERREAHLLELLQEIEAGHAADASVRSAEVAAAFDAVSVARSVVERIASVLQEKRVEEEAARVAAAAAVEQTRLLTKQLEEARKSLAASQKAHAEIEARDAASRQAMAAQQAEPAPAPQAPRPAIVPPAKPSNKAPSAIASPATAPVESLSGSASNAGSSGRERRSETRHAVDANARIFLVDVRSNLAGRILDVSMSGCRIRSIERFPVGIYRRVEVEFVLDGLPFRLPGVVQSLHDRFTVGIRFLDVSDRKREQLRMIIEEITEMRKEEQPSPESASV